MKIKGIKFPLDVSVVGKILSWNKIQSQDREPSEKEMHKR